MLSGLGKRFHRLYKVVFLHSYPINPTPISPFPTQSTLHPSSNSNTLYECGKIVGSFSAHYKWRMGSLYHVGGELYLPDPGSCGLDPGHLAWARTVQPLLKRLHAHDLSSKWRMCLRYFRIWDLRSNPFQNFQRLLIILTMRSQSGRRRKSTYGPCIPVSWAKSC